MIDIITANPSFTTIGVGITPTEASSLLQVKKTGANTSVFTVGVALPLLVSSSNNGQACFLNTDFSTNVADGLVFRQNDDGSATISNGMGPAATSEHGNKMVWYPTGREVRLYPGSRDQWASWSTETSNAGNGLENHVCNFLLTSYPDTVTDYFNGTHRVAAYDGANYATPYEWGVEGNWTNGGGYTLSRFYLWSIRANSDTGANVFYHESTSPNIFYIGGGTEMDAVLSDGRVVASGRTITTNANGTVAGASIGAHFTKTDANVRDFPVVQIKPTLNLTGSNANTTIALLDLDTVNTSVTGMAVGNLPLIRAAYGGSARLLYGATSGVFALSGPDGTTSAVQQRAYGTSVFPNIYGAKARNTQATPYRTQSGDVMFRLAAAGFQNDTDNTTLATESGASRARIDFVAGQDYTSTKQSAHVDFYNTDVDATTSTLKARLSNAGNLKLGVFGDLAFRGTTEGTKQLVLYDGVAPVGTLTNGVSFYSASGEARVMDAAGNSTLLSPHDAETNEWIFYSKHSVTGKVLRVDMERLMRAMDEHFGGGFVHDWVEA